MGAQHSTRSTAACETFPSRDGESSSFEPGGMAVDPRMTAKNSMSPIMPPVPMPQLMRSETFEEKLYRKVRFHLQYISFLREEIMMGMA